MPNFRHTHAFHEIGVGDSHLMGSLHEMLLAELSKRVGTAQWNHLHVYAYIEQMRVQSTA